MPLIHHSSLTLLAFVGVALACSAGAESQDRADAPHTSDRATESGGTSALDDEPQSAGGSSVELGGAHAEITHPLFGAGSSPNEEPTEPCVAAQQWEEGVNLDMTTGALIAKDGVVYEITGVGKTESTWADEWTAPPCTRDDAHCLDLVYQEVATCD